MPLRPAAGVPIFWPFWLVYQENANMSPFLGILSGLLFSCMIFPSAINCLKRKYRMISTGSLWSTTHCWLAYQWMYWNKEMKESLMNCAVEIIGGFAVSYWNWLISSKRLSHIWRSGRTEFPVFMAWWICWVGHESNLECCRRWKYMVYIVNRFLSRKARNRLTHAHNGNSMVKNKLKKRTKKFAYSSFPVIDRALIAKALSKLCGNLIDWIPIRNGFDLMVEPGICKILLFSFGA